MAYGTRWFSEFDDIHENVIYRIEVRERDYAGSATEVLSEGQEPLTIDMAKVENVFTPLRPQKATVKWMAQEGVDFQITDLYIDDDRKYQLHVFEYEGESLVPKWVGWVVPIELEEPFASKPYPVTFSATCGLPFLSDDYVLDSSGTFILGEKTLAQVIATCLTSTGLSLEIDTYISLLASGMSGSNPLTQAEIDADGLRGKHADETLSGILTPLRAYITQANGRWVIKGLVEQNAFEATRVRFSAAGVPTGTATVEQGAAIGRTAYEDGVHLRPTSEVVEKIAEPNSIITGTVSPGIPVNRLPNGLFAGAVLGGVIPGWNNHIGSIPWARNGFNTPESPYRLEFYQHIEFDPKKKKRAFKPFNYFDSGPITLNVGDFNIPTDRRKETKIVFSGAFKSNNSLSATFMLSINETEREFNDYLDDNGEWFYSKKEDRTYNKRTNQSKYEPDAKGYDDLELQTFEIESKKITNYLNNPDGAVVVLRLRIFPAIQGPGYIGGNIFFSLEDLALIVVEDTVFEGDHKYQIDAHLPIRNANEVEFTSIIADKIDITTPEQGRSVNRVMTGYMTLVGTDTLTSGWRYPGMVGYEPIQKLSLRTTLRQLAGPRLTIDGNFLGYDVTPDKSLFNRYYQPGVPSTFYSQTSWRWNVKDGTYDISATELNLFPLTEEDLYLFDDENGRRGNRMYRGASSSGTGGTSPKQVQEIVMDDAPTVYVTVGVQEIKVVDLAALIQSNHQPYELTAEVKHYTDWISHVGIDRGEEGLELKAYITAKALVPGTDRVLIELIGLDGEDLMFVINVVALPATKFTHYLIDKTGGGSVVVGKIKAGSGYLKPDLWEVKTVADGFHEGYFQQIAGPSVSASTASPYVAVDGTYLDEYTTPSAPVAGEVGTYQYAFSTWRNEGDPDNYGMVKADAINFTLFDAAYLAKLKFELWVGGVKLGDIDPDGSSAFNTEGQPFQIKMIVDGVLHDIATAILSFEGDPVKTTVYTQDPSVEDVTYELYSSTPAAQLKGRYELAFDAEEESESVYERQIGFTINEKKKEAVGGSLKLVQMRPGQSSYDVLGTLSLSGGLFTLAPWNVLADAPIVAGTRRSHRIFQKRGGGLVDIDTSLYTGRPQYRDYDEDLDEGDYLIFDGLSSENIDSIHENNTSFRVIVTDEIDGVVSEIFQADFSFGTLEDLDDLPIEEPYANANGDANRLAKFKDANSLVSSLIEEDGINLIAREGIYVSDFLPNGNARGLHLWADDEKRWDIGKAGLESTGDAGSNLVFWRYNDDGDFLGEALSINRATGKATFAKQVVISEGSLPPLVVSSSALVINFNADRLDGEHGPYYLDRANHTGSQAISTITGLQAALDARSSGTGVANRFALWTGANTLGTSNLYYNGGNVGVGMVPGYQFDVNGAIRCTTQFASTLATGTAPIDVASTTLCVNLNSDYLDNQHGSYYLSRANHTGTQAISTVNGLQAELDGKPDGSGAANRFAVWTGTNILATSNLYYNAGNVGVGMVPGYQFDVNGSIRYSNQLASSVATGTAPLDVVSTSLCVNLNADLLDGHHGAYYLDWDNFTDKPTTLAGYGITDAYIITDVNYLLDFRALKATTLTINGVTQDLSANRTWNVGTVTGTGSTDRFAVWTGSSSLATSNLYYNGGNIGVGMVPGYQFEVNGSIRYSNQLASTVGTGTAPLDVSSTSLCVNLNADLLDGQHGSYYLNWGNFTGKPTTLAGYGITDAYVITDVDYLLSFKANTSHTHTASQITDFTSAGRGLLSAGSGISYNSSTGVISYAGGSSPVAVVGASVNRTVRYASIGPPSELTDGHIHDDGVTIEFLNPCVIYKGTEIQRQSYATPETGMLWMQTTAGAGGAGLYYCLYLAGVGAWIKSDGGYVDYI